MLLDGRLILEVLPPLYSVELVLYISTSVSWLAEAVE